MLKPHQRHYAAAFLLDFALTSGITAMPFYIYDYLGGDARTSGTIGGLQSAVYAGVCLMSSRFLSSSPHGLLWAILGSSIFALFFAASILVGNVYWCAVCCIIGMGGMALFWPAMQSWLGTEPDPVIRAKHIGVYNLSWTLGLAFGSVAGGRLYDMAYWLPFALLFVCSVCAAALVASLPHETTHFNADARRDTSDAAEAEVRRSEAYVVAAWLGNLVVWSYIGVLRNVFSKRIDDVVASNALTILGEGPPWSDWFTEARIFSYLSLSMYLVHGLLSVQLGRMHFWKHRLWVAIAFQALGAAAFYVLGVTTEFGVMWLCFIAVGISCSVCFFASLSYSVARSEKKHNRAAVHEGMVGAGGLVGSISFGQLAAVYGLTWPFLMTPLLLVVPVILQIWLVRAGMRRSGLNG